jgi:CspA family cold shock protein
MAGMNVMNGTVKWFDVRKGYGFISDEDGVDSYVHFSNINMEGFRKLRAGQRVTFVPDEDEHGRAMAREVTVISEEE